MLLKHTSRASNLPWGEGRLLEQAGGDLRSEEWTVNQGSGGGGGGGWGVVVGGEQTDNSVLPGQKTA